MDLEPPDAEQLLEEVERNHQSGLKWLENLELNTVEDEVMRASVEQDIRSLKSRLDKSTNVAVFLASLISVCDRPSEYDFRRVLDSTPEHAIEIGLSMISAVLKHGFDDLNN